MTRVLPLRSSMLATEHMRAAQHRRKFTSPRGTLGVETKVSEAVFFFWCLLGMVSIMSYRNADNSYSMWKGGPASTWFTAFALRVMGQVHRYVPQSQDSICNALMWLIEHCQLENGSFKENSHYQPLKLQGTLSTEAQETALYLTAFTVIGIRKAFDICPLLKISTALAKADTFLLENTLSTQSTFTLAIAAYALSLGDKSHRQFRSIVSALKRKASVKGIAGSTHSSASVY